MFKKQKQEEKVPFPKYPIGMQVFMLSNDHIVEKCIFGTRIVKKMYGFVVEYRFTSEDNAYGWTEEKNIFTSREELIKSL